MKSNILLSLLLICSAFLNISLLKVTPTIKEDLHHDRSSHRGGPPSSTGSIRLVRQRTNSDKAEDTGRTIKLQWSIAKEIIGERILAKDGYCDITLIRMFSLTSTHVQRINDALSRFYEASRLIVAENSLITEPEDGSAIAIEVGAHHTQSDAAFSDFRSDVTKILGPEKAESFVEAVMQDRHFYALGDSVTIEFNRFLSLYKINYADQQEKPKLLTRGELQVRFGDVIESLETPKREE